MRLITLPALLTGPCGRDASRLGIPILTVPNFRLLAAWIFMLPLLRQRELERLFALTAEAFGCPVPEPVSRTVRGRLLAYARFTRQQAENAFASGTDTESLSIRLYAAALALGLEYRLRLGLRNFGEALSALRLLYKALGIDFRGTQDGGVEISSCIFAKFYTPRICALVSALDRGLVAGLTGGAAFAFTRRLTEGAACCRACITGVPAWN